jgi:flagellar hook-length control protein FliK
MHEAHPAREIARPDVGPIAANTEGHATREAAHLSPPPTPTAALPDRADIVQQIARAARVQLDAGQTELTVRLDPPSLGAVHMRVVAQVATLTAHLQVSTEASRQLVSDGLPALRQALAEAGIDIGQVSVSVDGGAQQQLPHGQLPPPQWRPEPAMAPGALGDEAQVAPVLQAWASGGGPHFDAFA